MTPTAGQLPGKVRNTLMLDATMKQLAEQLKDEHRCRKGFGVYTFYTFPTIQPHAHLSEP